MKASELIEQLQEIVAEYGDREVEVNGEYNTDYPLNTVSRLEITRVDIFADSDNIQVLIDNDN